MADPNQPNPTSPPPAAPKPEPKPAVRQEGPQYELLTEHYLDDVHMPPGTIIGEGTNYPFTDPEGKPVPPSQHMRPLNDAAKTEVKKVANRNANPVDSIPIRGAQ